MHQLTPTVSLESLGVWLSLAGFGIYHGLNPAMGWLFALARGLQQETTRAIWLALIPIALGHAASIALAAGAVVALHEVLSLDVLEWVTAGLLIGFGVYKLVNWYRHPRWVGMRVKWHELAGWSFLMATAHGAGLMAAPALLGVMTVCLFMPLSEFCSDLAVSMASVVPPTAWTQIRWIGVFFAGALNMSCLIIM